MSEMFDSLQYLPKAPENFRECCKNATSREDLVLLAQYRLNETQLTHLAKANARIDKATPVKKLGILSNSTTDFLFPSIVSSCLRHDLDVNIVVADYGQVLQSALDSQSQIYQQHCDTVLVAVDAAGLPVSPTNAGQDHAKSVEEVVEFFATIINSLTNHGIPTVLLQNFPYPATSLFGNFDSLLPGTAHTFFSTLNHELKKLVKNNSSVYLVDIEHMANTVGLLNWHDPKLWNIAKLPFSQKYLPLYAENIARILSALMGKTKKCLVLDLDNTLWGGVIGDDGLEGIELGQGSAIGEAFSGIQNAVLTLKKRGIILAVCSKNDEKIAKQPFEEHPDMILKLDDISVFQANWMDKASNLETISKALNIGIDSLVLLDDNPAERSQVREALPQVGIPELPDDPALYASTLLNAGYFEAVSFSEEDAQRTTQYAANAKRASLKTTARNLDAFWASLKMDIFFSPFDAMGRERITQLINKTNLFNLTTKRYTNSDVECFEKDPNTWTLQVRLKDKFGDNGMISVIICRLLDQKTWEIDTWLMSCRVLGRQVEQAVLNEMCGEARYIGISHLYADYIPTPKNNLVASHYEKMGFAQCESPKKDHTRWVLDIADKKDFLVPIKVRRI